MSTYSIRLMCYKCVVWFKVHKKANSCDVCDHGASSNSILTMHKEVNSCDVCDHGVRNISAMTMHMKYDKHEFKY